MFGVAATEFIEFLGGVISGESLVATAGDIGEAGLSRIWRNAVDALDFGDVYRDFVYNFDGDYSSLRHEAEIGAAGSFFGAPFAAVEAYNRVSRSGMSDGAPVRRFVQAPVRGAPTRRFVQAPVHSFGSSEGILRRDVPFGGLNVSSFVIFLCF